MNRYDQVTLRTLAQGPVLPICPVEINGGEWGLPARRREGFWGAEKNWNCGQWVTYRKKVRYCCDKN